MLKTTVVRWIIRLNIIVFVLWYLVSLEGSLFMQRNFLVSWTGLEEGRYWTLLTSVFSHNAFLHILINMYVFFGFGTALETVLGPKRFLSFYLTAGVISSFTHCLVSAFLMGEPSQEALGASGAVAGVILVFSFIFPREKILLLGFVPIPAIWGALLLVGLDLWGLSFQVKGEGLPIGHGAHLGGAATGLIYYFFFLRRHFAKGTPGP